MYKKTISLYATENIDRVELGTKASGLFQIIRMGFSVPKGFCIFASAFREHLEINKLVSYIESVLYQLADSKSEVKGSLLLDIQKSIINAPLAENIRSEIENDYRTLAADRIAVRSSATAEDLTGHSFAGQYETYLGVADIAGCIDTIKKCWASLWTERAYDYRQKNGFDHLKVNMAVIVQSLVPADSAGVIFTTDPVTGSSSRIIIESSFGLGQALVSGKVTPDKFVVSKHNLKIISRRISNKKIECVIDNIGSVQEKPIEDERISTPSVNNKTIKKLAKLARKAETKFVCPQDIEWAISDNKIFFLQSRPITALPPEKSWEDRQIWTNANAGEVIPDVVTPVSWSMVDIFIKKLFDSFFGWFGFDLKDNPMAGLIAGRPYFNINTYTGIAKHIPKRFQWNINDIFGGEHKDMFGKGLLDIPQEDMADIKFSFIKFIIKMPVFIFNFLFYGDKNIKSYISRLSAGSDSLESLEFDTMSEYKLDAALNFVIENSFDFELKNFVGIIKGFHCYMMLNVICKKWFKDGTLTGRLLVGAGNMEDAQAGIEMWKLAQEAHKFNEIEKIILSGEHWRDIEEKLAKDRNGAEFLKSWNTFMVRHGHHARGEAELFNPRWSEMPDYILRLVRGYVNDIEKYNPVDSQSLRKLESQQLFQRCCRELKNPFKRLLFKYLLWQAKQGVSFRENWKNQMVRRMALIRKMLLWFGQWLEKRDIIEKTDDIFFLKYQEIASLVQEKADFDVKNIITRRKAEYEKNKTIDLPKVIIGKFDPDNFVSDKEDINANAKIFSGLSVSPGIVTGKARVILRADTNECVKAGEILVAPFTDPGWTPYFITAAGIVIDMGGLLSHGSIIAREYGIPAVVNVGPATKIIKTGQTIKVDGNRGEVRILH